MDRELPHPFSGREQESVDQRQTVARPAKRLGPGANSAGPPCGGGRRERERSPADPGAIGVRRRKDPLNPTGSARGSAAENEQRLRPGMNPESKLNAETVAAPKNDRDPLAELSEFLQRSRTPDARCPAPLERPRGSYPILRPAHKRGTRGDGSVGSSRAKRERCKRSSPSSIRSAPRESTPPDPHVVDRRTDHGR